VSSKSKNSLFDGLREEEKGIWKSWITHTIVNSNFG